MGESQRPCHIVTLRLCASSHPGCHCEQQHKTSHREPRCRPIQEMPPPIRWEKVGTVALIVTRATTTLRHIGLLTSDSNPASPNWTWSHLALNQPPSCVLDQLVSFQSSYSSLTEFELFHSSSKKDGMLRIFAISDIMMKICGWWVKDEGRKRGGEEEPTERGSGADGGLSSQIDST